MAVLEIRDGRCFDEEASIVALKESLASFKVPKRIVVVDKITKNAMGKIVKNELRDRFKDAFLSDATAES